MGHVSFVWFSFKGRHLLVCMSLRKHLRCMYLRTSRTEDVSPKNHSLEVCEKTAPGDVSQTRGTWEKLLTSPGFLAGF